MEIYYITGNKSKFDEAQLILNNVKLISLDLKTEELQTISQEEVVLKKAEQAFKALKKPVIVDDTGIFFSDYKDFPGTFTRTLFDCIGFKGVEKLLEGTSRKAYFKTLLCYKDEKVTKIFSGDWKGKIISEISKKFNPDWQYNSIFIPEDFSVPLSELSMEERAKHSHRKKALDKLAKYLRINQK